MIKNSDWPQNIFLWNTIKLDKFSSKIIKKIAIFIVESILILNSNKSNAKINKGMITSIIFNRENQQYLIFDLETKLDNEKPDL